MVMEMFGVNSHSTEAGVPAAALDRLQNNITLAFLGKPDVVRFALVALLAEGHLLVEDVPGVGKTLLAKSLARSLNCSFHRIQFTPDLLPGDLIGTSIFHQPTSSFVFQPGPIFAQIVLADEINRATPRTQSALLEAMSDRQVSVDGQTRRLGPPFIVLATQNPYEFEGTYPLPESQLDRFMLRIRVGYPDRANELSVLTQHRAGEPVDSLKSVIEVDDILALQAAVRNVKVSDPLAGYLLDIVTATRHHKDVTLGASTRAALALYRASQAYALFDRRDFVTPDDVKVLVVPVLAHRLLTKQFRGTGDAATNILNDILQHTVVPA